MVGGVLDLELLMEEVSKHRDWRVGGFTQTIHLLLDLTSPFWHFWARCLYSFHREIISRWGKVKLHINWFAFPLVLCCPMMVE